eukprot:2729412-Pleurochrysis_carterae.AAC.2
MSAQKNLTSSLVRVKEMPSSQKHQQALIHLRSKLSSSLHPNIDPVPDATLRRNRQFTSSAGSVRCVAATCRLGLRHSHVKSINKAFLGLRMPGLQVMTQVAAALVATLCL